MKSKEDTPTMVYVACVLLATIFWGVLFSSRMDDLVKSLYFIFFLPFTASPFIMWVIHKEGQEPEGYLENQYAGRAGLTWVVRIVMMAAISTLSSIAAVLILGALAFVYQLFAGP